MGTEPINGRVWLSDALTAGAFVEPEDPDQTAEVDGRVVPLVSLAVVVIRRLGDQPDMPLAEIADRVGRPLDEIEFAQEALERVAADVGR
jgi:hypothetical protein